jgi:hypothetical protein
LWEIFSQYFCEKYNFSVFLIQAQPEGPPESAQKRQEHAVSVPFSVGSISNCQISGDLGHFKGSELPVDQFSIVKKHFFSIFFHFQDLGGMSKQFLNILKKIHLKLGTKTEFQNGNVFFKIWSLKSI